jgi:hypothetical protein
MPTEEMPPTSILPYRDPKPVGAADFYFAINATFRFIRQRFGEEGLRRYWRELGERYYQPVARIWQSGGLESVARYWREFFAAEPGAEVEVHEEGNGVNLEVRICPAIAHLRAGGRAIEPDFCQHCYFVSEAIASQAGLTVRVDGGNGQCVQRFFSPTPTTEPQDLRRIRSCA